MKPTIFHVRSGFKLGGPEKLIIPPLAYMKDSEFDFVLSSFVVDGVKNEFLEKAAAEGIATEAIPVNGSFDTSAIGTLRELLKKHSAALLVCHDYRAVIIGNFAARKLGIPKLAVAHGWTGQSLKVKVYETIERFALRRMDRVVAVSSLKYEELLNSGIAPERLIKIFNSVEIPYDDIPPRLHTLKEEYGLSPETLLIGTVGRLSIEKGHRYFVEAIRILKESYPDVRYVFIGEGSEMDAVKAQIERHNLKDEIILTGWRSDMETIYRGLDVFVLSSLTEGLPVALLEALSYGVPAVATAVGGSPDVIIDSENGYLVPSENPDELANAIGKLISDQALRERFGRAGFERAKNTFSMSAYARSFLTLYRELLAEKRV